MIRTWIGSSNGFWQPASGAIFWPPPPLWGRVGERGPSRDQAVRMGPGPRAGALAGSVSNFPSPQPSPTRGEGARRSLQFIAALAWASIACLVGFASPRASASEPARLARIEVYPTRVRLESARREAHPIVTGYAVDGSVRDLTREATFTPDDPRVVAIDKGTVRPSGDGRSSVAVRVQGKECRFEVEVDHFSDLEPVSFRNEAIAALTKPGCNSGGCHGSPSGKGGFSLSMMGYDPLADRRVLTRAGWSRRTNPIEPEASLMLRKATAKVAHGGGLKLRESDTSYRLLRDWIAQGCKTDLDQAISLVKLEVYPESGRVLREPFASQQLLVIAHYADGSTRDVTRIASYTSSEEGVAAVGPDGLVEGKDRGEIAVSVRYLDAVVARTFTFVKEIPGFAWTDPPSNNRVDDLVHAQLKLLGYLPSGTCTDSEFLRRIYLDVVGLLPTVEETRAFLADGSPDKRARLVDGLLERPEYASYWGQRQADLLRVTRQSLTQEGARRYYDWIVESVRSNQAYDQFVRELLTAEGDTYERPSANYYRAAADTNSVTESTVQLFMGVRIGCAKCHNHPFDRWTQDNYYGIAAVFDRVRRELVPVPRAGGEPKAQKKQRRERPPEGPMMIKVAGEGATIQPRTHKEMKPWLPLVGDAAVEPGGDARKAFAGWLAGAENPFLARVLVNRIWAHVMGRGIVDPVDDFHSTNPPSNAALLDFLADDFARNGFDRKRTLRLILNSRTYQRSVAKDPSNAGDSKHFASAQVRLIAAEPLFDAIGRVTEVSERFSGVPAGTLATQMPTPPRMEFLEAFGQPKRETACQCERGAEPSLAQALQLLNGPAVQGRLSDDKNRPHRLIREGKADREVVEELYLAALCRAPTESESTRAVAYVDAHPERDKAFEDVLWAILNSKEFIFQH